MIFLSLVTLLVSSIELPGVWGMVTEPEHPPQTILLPCTHSTPENTDALLLLPSSPTSSVRSVLECAQMCQEDRVCTRAVFHQTTKDCTLIANGSLSETATDNEDDGLGNCFVLFKTPSDSTHPNNGDKDDDDDDDDDNDDNDDDDNDDDKDLISVQDIDGHSFKLVTVNSSIQSDMYIESVSNIFHDDTGNLVVTAFHHQLVYHEEHGIGPLDRFSYSTDGMSTSMQAYVDLKGELVGIDQDQTSYLSHQQEQETITAGSIAEVKAGLLAGYTRAGPNPSRASITDDGDDVHFHLAGVFTMASQYERSAAPKELYLTSVKEYMKSGERYVFRHKVHGDGSSLAVNKEEAAGSWRMDTAWSLLEINTTDSIDAVLRSHIEAGKELRLVMDGRVSSDVTSIRTTTKDICVIMPPYLTPADGRGANDDHQRIRFSALTMSGFLLECETEVQGATAYRNGKGDYPAQIDWFVSKRKFKKVFERKTDKYKTITFGSEEELYAAVTKLKNIRVCTHGNLDGLNCNNPASVTVTSDHHVIFLTHISVKTTMDKQRRISSFHKNCQRKGHVISSEGWMRYYEYTTGYPENVVTGFSSYKKQVWFVQDD